MLKMEKTYMDELSTKSGNLLTIISVTKVWSDLKVNPEVENDLDLLATKPIFLRKKSCT